MNTMEHAALGGAENNQSQETIMSIVAQIQTLEAELAKLKTDQEQLRQMPERAEKNTLLGEIEEKIRATISSISELQNAKMERVREGDEKYIIKQDTTLPSGSTLEEDPFQGDPQSLGSWRKLNRN